MGPVGFEPTTNRLCVPLQLSLPLSGLWSGLSLHPSEEGACRLVSTPSSGTAGGLARDYHCHIYVASGFPEFDRLSPGDYSPGSPCKKVISEVQFSYERII